MRVEIDQWACRGEGLCERICPQVFRVIGGVSVVGLDPVPRAAEPVCREAVEHCPAGAIRIVMDADLPPNRKRKR